MFDNLHSVTVGVTKNGIYQLIEFIVPVRLLPYLYHGTDPFHSVGSPETIVAAICSKTFDIAVEDGHAAPNQPIGINFCNNPSMQAYFIFLDRIVFQKFFVAFPRTFDF
jgi:hypothetical protein